MPSVPVANDAWFSKIGNINRRAKSTRLDYSVKEVPDVHFLSVDSLRLHGVCCVGRPSALACVWFRLCYLWSSLLPRPEDSRLGWKGECLYSGFSGVYLLAVGEVFPPPPFVSSNVWFTRTVLFDSPVRMNSAVPAILWTRLTRDFTRVGAAL